MEFLERIEHGPRSEVWRVRIAGAIATAHVFEDEDFDYIQLIVRGTQRWLPFDHPRVVPVLSLSTAGQRLVIATGDERGPSITSAAKQLVAAIIDREAWAVAEIIALADALAAMSELVPDFVHRRANPEQIIIGVDGHARFRAPIEHVSIGTVPNYLGRGAGVVTGYAWMSPEQVRGKQLTPASDVYQLATTLYTLLTGERLARGDSDYEVLCSIRDRIAPPPLRTQAPGLAEIVVRGLAIDLADRYPHPAAFAAALRSVPIGDPPAAAFDIAGRYQHPAPSRSVAITAGRCQMQWNELTTTGTEGIRHCATCDHDVVRVSSALALVPLLGKRCVAFQSDDN